MFIITFLALFINMGMITCFLKGSFIIMLILGLFFLLLLSITFWTSAIFLTKRFGNTSLMFTMLFKLYLDAWVYNSFELTLFLIDDIFNLANTSLISLGGMEKETFKTSINLFLLRISFEIRFGCLLNYNKRHW